VKDIEETRRELTRLKIKSC